MKQQIKFVLGAIISLTGSYMVWRELREVRAAKPFWAIAHKPGTALITGASSGMGSVFARRLAKKGYDLILVARREERLSVLADELRHRYPTRSDILVADLATEAGVNQVIKKIAKVDRLSLLINNAGFGTTGLLAETDPISQRDMVRVHIEASIQLVRAALPNMLNEGYGGIINVSSVAAFFRPAGSANYCASKAYLNAFSQALHDELRGTGVHVQALCPGFTYTEFHETPEFHDFSRTQIPDILWMTAEQVVDISLAALGHTQVIVIPGFINRLVVLFSKTGIGPIIEMVARRLIRPTGKANDEPN